MIWEESRVDVRRGYDMREDGMIWEDMIWYERGGYDRRGEGEKSRWGY